MCAASTGGIVTVIALSKHSATVYTSLPKPKRDEAAEAAAAQGQTLAAWVRSLIYRALREQTT